MDEISGLRGLLVGKEQSLAERMRRRRWNLVTRLIPDLTQLRVLDLGGTGLWWARAPTRPREVTVINLDPGPGVTGVKAVRGDVLEADQLVGDEQFDLVFSNSLIEHLRGHSARVRFAELTTSLAPRYVVQTPYRYFPIEPHWIFPCFQFLPLAVGARVAPRWPLGHTRGWDARAATDEVMSTHLLSASEMSFYFPQAHIAWERVAGLRKSMFAVG